MFKLSSLASSKKQPITNSYITKNKAKNKAKKKTQARRNKAHEAIELVWLQKIFTKKVSLIVLLISALFSVPYLIPKDDILPINKIQVSGEYQRIDKDAINSALNSYLGKGFFSVDIKSVKHSIGLDPWIKTVSVKRIWPGELHVHLIEKIAVARWDSKHLLSQQAVIFKADIKAFTQLPKINGYAAQSKQLLQRYRQMQHEFSRQGITIAELSEDSKGALKLLLNKNLKVNIGSENNEMKINHLLAVYPQQIKPRVELIKHIDFRYNNGFSIAWKDEYLKQLEDAEKRGNKNV